MTERDKPNPINPDEESNKSQSLPDADYRMYLYYMLQDHIIDHSLTPIEIHELIELYMNTITGTSDADDDYDETYNITSFDGEIKLDTEGNINPDYIKSELKSYTLTKNTPSFINSPENTSDDIRKGKFKFEDTKDFYE